MLINDSVENRNFRMHPALLWSVIQSQAGTPEKALLEAIMNAVDANATYCDITINENGYVIKDDGRGFQSKSEIEEFFETFGTPHKEGDSTYGKFRMGRGQLFAFSTTVWKSSSFSMSVDIKSKGLSYELITDLSPVPGCTIEGKWYDRLDLSEVIRVTHELTQLAKWMQITININGKKINKIAANEAWTIETDDAYISVKSAGGLSVYNLGALVRIYPPHQFGLSGIIVSKTRLQVNFARNDILLSECKVWKRIKNELDKICGSLVRKRNLYDFERDALAARFARGEVKYSEISNLGLVIDVSGKKRSLSELANANTICMVPDKKDWAIGERVMNQKLAFVISSQTLHRFNVETLVELIELLKLHTNVSKEDTLIQESLEKDRNKFLIEQDLIRKNDPKGFKDNVEYNRLSLKIDLIWREISNLHISSKYYYRGIFDHLKIVSLDDVAKHINDTYVLLEPDTLSPHQKAFAKSLQSASDVINRIVSNHNYSKNNKDITPYSEEFVESKEIGARKMFIGSSDVADAWTDGESYISINVNLINDVLKGTASINSLCAIIFHEYCHQEPDIGGHIHSPDFYELFHEYVCSTWALECARYWLLKGYTNAIMELGKKPNVKMMQAIRDDSKSLGDASQHIENKFHE